MVSPLVLEVPMRILISLIALILAAPAAAISLTDALARGSGAAVAAALAGGGDPNMMLVDGRTPLVWAVQENKVAIARTLLAYGADPDAPSQLEFGMTAMMAASVEPNMEIMQLLLDNGANVNTLDSRGDPAINWAANYGHANLVQVLLDAGANPGIASSHGAVLEIALRRGHRDIVDLLIRRRLVGTMLEGRESLVQTDVINGDPTSLRRRLEYASADTRDPASTPMLVLAAWAGNAAVVDALLENGATVDAMDAIGYTAFSHAAREGHLNVMQRLIDAGADVEHRGSDVGLGLTPLMLAAGEGQIETTLQLIAIGADLEVRNSAEQHAAMWALANGQRETAEILIGAGSSLDLRDAEGNTMIGIARRYGFDAMAQQLQADGAPL
jgi:ankyrin repeat protein